MPPAVAQESAILRFHSLLSSAFIEGTLVKLTFGKPTPQSQEPDLKNVYVRPVNLKSGPHFTFVYRYATRDVTKNFPPAIALETARSLLGTAFCDAHLFTPLQSAQVEIDAEGKARLRQMVAAHAPTSRSERHDREKRRPVPLTTGWLHLLGVTNAQGRPREGMAAKLRQIQKFAEILNSLLTEAGLLRRTDMGDHVWRFELASGPEKGHESGLHPHFVCNSCGDVTCLPDDAIEIHVGRGAPKSLKGRTVEIQVKGRCDDCG